MPLSQKVCKVEMSQKDIYTFLDCEPSPDSYSEPLENGHAGLVLSTELRIRNVEVDKSGTSRVWDLPIDRIRL